MTKALDHEHELFFKAAPASVPDLPAAGDEWRWLWHSDYYDGPINGMILRNGEELWAQAIEQGDSTRCGFYRKYLLTRLTPEAHAEQARRHERFREMVGIHCDYDENGRRAGRFTSPPGWHDFYDEAKSWPEWKPDGAPVAIATT